MAEAGDGDEIVAIMLNIIVLMSLGYAIHLAGPLRTAEQRAVLGMFMTCLSLPSLFFATLSQEDFRDTSMAVLLAVVIAKICMLAFGYAFGRVAREHPRPALGSRELYAGMFSLLTTNGDEVGLGVPVVGALFPERMPMLFVLAGIQKMCFLPPALVLLGMSGAIRRSGEYPGGAAGARILNILREVLRAKLQDPLVLGILFGTLYNVLGPALPREDDAPWTIAGYTPGLFGGAKVHPYVKTVCTTLAAAFTPIIFVLSGAASVGIYSALLDWDNIVLPLTLVVLKSVILPTIILCILSVFGAADDVKDFAFVFGMFPASGANMVYIVNYQPNPRQTATLMGTLALSKIVAFPLLLLASRLMFTADEAVQGELRGVGVFVRSLSLPLCVWTFVYTTFFRRANASLIAFLGLECVFLASDFFEGALGAAVICSLGWASEAALVSVAAVYVFRFYRVGRQTSEVSRVAQGDYRLVEDPQSRGSVVSPFARLPFVVCAAVLAGAALEAVSDGLFHTHALARFTWSDVLWPVSVPVVHLGFAFLLVVSFLALLHYDAEFDLREVDKDLHNMLQRINVVLVLGATQQILASYTLSSLGELPSDAIPRGSFALLAAMAAILGKGRGCVLFIVFGWHGLRDFCSSGRKTAPVAGSKGIEAAIE
ncbi:hypothetical protein AB1Y20_014750 [Prymnesium parvum]|uniref:Protein RFT1 homolog n=1 Tax=Prymnesium parvum TaxID=97485 RepID=A0AB34IEY8_PRYPA|mmetsp:Transcript_19701/g.47199  ORF Transcript_19701/g.47199 Transcript_19701/m.47199 type:complete len:656 (-) Transcript_19701:245-2212(-)